MNSKSKGKIGIFDSGFGGLSIMKHIVKKLPQYNYVYLGDTARAPYGSRSHDTIFEYTKAGVEFLFAQGAEIVILACNSASAEALRKIQQEYLVGKRKDKKVLGVIFPAVEEAINKTKNNRIGVIGTEATVASHAFRREMMKLNPKVKIFERSASLLVPIVEAGEDKSKSAKLLIKKYIEDVKKDKVDTLILGCTHYGILKNEIKKNVGDVNIIDEGPVVARKLCEYLRKHMEIDKKLSKKRGREFFTTDLEGKFDRLGSRFFGRDVKSKRVDL